MGYSDRPCERCGAMIPRAYNTRRFCSECRRETANARRKASRAKEKAEQQAQKPKPADSRQTIRSVNDAAQTDGLSYGHYVHLAEPRRASQRPEKMTRYETIRALSLRREGKSYTEIAKLLDRPQKEVYIAVQTLREAGAVKCDLCRWRPVDGRACIWPRCIYDL